MRKAGYERSVSSSTSAATPEIAARSPKRSRASQAVHDGPEKSSIWPTEKKGKIINRAASRGIRRLEDSFEHQEGISSREECPVSDTGTNFGIEPAS
jgi:hypothetical protein